MKKSIAIYGGAFSPPHIGHLRAARAFLEQSGAGQLIIMPTKIPPHKILDLGAGDVDRMNMARLCFESDPILKGKCEVSDHEMSVCGVSYTINTVEHFRSLGYEDISILIGTDMLLSFESWYRFRDLFSFVTVYYIDRDEDKRKECEDCAIEYSLKYGAKIRHLECPVFELSSTDIRSLIKNDGNTEGLVSEGVRGYIEKNGLYR